MTKDPIAPRRVAAISLAILVVGTAGLFGFSASAEAGTYASRFCFQGETPNGDKGPFERAGNETVYSLANACGNFNGLRVSHNAGEEANVDAEGRWLAERPDGVTVTGITYKAAGAEKTGGYRAQVIGDADGDPDLDLIQGGSQLTGDYSDFAIAGDVRRFGVRLICVNDTGPTCGANPEDPEAKLKDVTYTLTDPVAPTLSVNGGSLFAGEVQAGAQGVTFDATDVGAGVRRVWVLANGQLAGEAVADCELAGGYGLTFKPCRPAFGGEIAVDTAAVPWHDGANKVRVCAEDFSTDGTQNVACSQTTTVRVLNGCAVNAAPVNIAETLGLEWPGKRNAAIQARQGRAREALVTLHGPAGLPLAGAAVCISRSIPDGRGLERVMEPGAITGPDGSVAVKVRGASSRTVYATYWAGPEAAITSSLEMLVAPRIKVGLRPEDKLEVGEKALVVAKLRGKWKADRRVCFFAERPGNDRISCGRSGPGGRAKAVYEPTEPGRIFLYAKVPNQKGYPYVNSRSRKLQARVID
jgi:hypothetical protein